MSLFRTKTVQQPVYTGLQIQTATNALPIPIVWGQARISPNAIWYDNFQLSKQGGGKGGLFSSSSSTVDYTAAVIMAISEGPISGIGQIWKDQATYSLTELGLSLFTGTTPQAVWSFLSAAYPAQALTYQGTAYVASPDYNLGPSATISNHNFEVIGVFAGTGVNGVDADPAQVVNDFLTNAQYGVGFPSASINATTLFGSGGDASYQTYCKATGLALSPALTDQESAQSILARWLQLTNTAAVWSGGELKFIPYGDSEIVAGTIVATSQVRQIIPPPVPASGATPPPSIIVCPAAYFVADKGVTNAQTGAAYTYIGTGAPSNTGTYGISPAGTYLFAAGDENSLVSIAYTYQIAATFVPNVTPVYDLTDDDIIYEDGEDPIKVTRSDPFQAYNVWRLEISERDNAYALTPVEVRDQDAIERFGLRVASSVSAHEICDEAVAVISGQLILQRALYIRTTHKFKLAWEFCLLDPMDIVGLNDVNLGFDNFTVRITQIEEDDNGLLTVTAEEFLPCVSTAPLYPTQGGSPYPINRNVAVSPVNPPFIFEPPAALTNGTPQVWAAVSGGASGVEDPNWGGANVYLSLDGTTYSEIGTITGPARQGVLTAALPAFTGTNPDTEDTLAVNLTESGGTLASATLLDAQNGATLAIVDHELITYATSALTAANQYALTVLFRGLDSSAAAAHASGAPFARLDDAIFKYDLPQTAIGQTLYLKFQSFNTFGNALQDLSTCAVYTYTPLGSGLLGPVAQALAAGISLDYQLATQPVSESDDFGFASDPYATVIDMGTISS